MCSCPAALRVLCRRSQSARSHTGLRLQPPRTRPGTRPSGQPSRWPRSSPPAHAYALRPRVGHACPWSQSRPALLASGTGELLRTNCRPIAIKRALKTGLMKGPPVTVTPRRLQTVTSGNLTVSESWSRVVCWPRGKAGGSQAWRSRADVQGGTERGAMGTGAGSVRATAGGPALLPGLHGTPSPVPGQRLHSEGHAVPAPAQSALGQLRARSTCQDVLLLFSHQVQATPHSNRKNGSRDTAGKRKK